MSDGCIIVGGVKYPLGGLGGEVTVRTWHQHGVQFRPGHGYNKRRRHPIELAIWHWTGSENDALTMAAHLAKRKLGIEFAIDRDGTVCQFCDPCDVDTADAGSVNGRSVGVEIVSYGIRSASRLWLLPKAGRDRKTYEAQIHGRWRTVAEFYPAQVTAAIALAEALSTALPIPRKVPTTSMGRLVTHKLGGAHLLSFRGHLGHYHVTDSKLDPGPKLLEEIGRELSIGTKRGAEA